MSARASHSASPAGSKSGLRSRRRVVVCGGGVAGIEAVLALRALLDLGADLHMVAPNRKFVYQPLAVAAPFDLAETQLFDLAELARDQNAELHVDSLESVEAEHKRVRLASGATLPYDDLIVAVGARRCDWLEGALHFSGGASVTAFRALLERLERGAVEQLCFVNPAVISWTLPLYELALLTASRLAERGVPGVELTVVTPEEDPLAVFGPAASQMLRGLLADRGIALKARAYAEKIQGGKLYLHPAATLEVDQVVTLAQLEGPALSGLPSDADGFVIVDEHSRVAGLDDVYAAGDGTTFPVKQGGIATQQADAAAEAIAAQMDAARMAAPMRPTLRGMLLTGIAPIYLRAQIAGRTGDRFDTASSPLWWPPSKIAGRYLAPYVADNNPLNRGETLQDRPRLTRDSDTLEESHQEARQLALTFADRDAADHHFKSALQWLEVLERLDGVLPSGYLQKKAVWQGRAGERATGGSPARPSP
jgi:sulfide:quinone oxidoreductase